MLATAIQNFTDEGGILITAAGNSAEDAGNFFPCNLSQTNPRVVCVSASTTSDLFATAFANFNPNYVTIAAPGVSILSSVLDDDYQVMDGTSMSTPMVASALSLIKTYRDDLSRDDALQALYDGADQLPALESYVQEGKRLNIYESLKLVDTF